MSQKEPLRVLHLAKWAPPVRGGIETVVNETVDAMSDSPASTLSALRYTSQGAVSHRQRWGTACVS
jgi:hypothetical protein